MQQQIVMLHNVFNVQYWMRELGMKNDNQYLFSLQTSNNTQMTKDFRGNNRHPMNLICYLFHEMTRLSNIVVMMRVLKRRKGTKERERRCYYMLKSGLMN
jgi:hypothetical protein